jgi:ElaB/YqjD/DUF883 family membrane-anchored ribosome-binding protein
MAYSTTNHDPKYDNAANKAAGVAADMTHKAGEQFERVSHQVEGAAKAVAETGREMGDKVGVVAENLRGAVDKSVKEQPMTTLALAAVAGFVLGAVWKA